MSIGPGTRLGSYVVQDFIGQGAMGVVYRAYHAQLERSCAVKVLQGLATDGDSSARFRREAQAIAHMRHPNVLNVFDFGEFEGTPYMIVEYVDGGSLAARIRSAPVDQESALRYLRGIGAALDYAHSLGIVHRDVKPANVLLGPDDAPILADFGLVKLMQSSSIVSMTGVTTGTPAYMAPEQVSGKQVGPAADRYSFAVMAYEMLTGSFPYREDGVLEVLYAHVHNEPITASTVNPALGPRTDAVLHRGLAKDPAQRWDSCHDFVTALEQTLRSTTPASERTAVFAPPAPTATAVAVAVATDPLVARAEPAAATVAVVDRPQPATVAVALPHADDKRRRRLVVMIGAAALILLLLIGSAFVFEATQSPTLDVSPRVATFGDQVVVTAKHVPGNQSGEIRLQSVLHTFPFRAGADGNVRVNLTVPNDIETGDHLLRICWSDLCRAQTTLKVVAGVALASPLPGSSPTSNPSQSPSPGSTPSTAPGSSPRPGSSPTSNPTSGPSPKPTSPPPPPPPTPSTNPCPTSTSAASLTTSGGLLLSAVTATAHNFTPNTAITVRFYFPSTSSTPVKTVPGTVTCNGVFTASWTPSALDVGTGRVTAVDGAGRNATVSFSVTA